MPPKLTLPRFYPILDTEIAARNGIDPVSAARQILEGGATILQFRHKGFFTREVFAQLERVAELCRNAGALMVVNDRADLAALTGAALHLGQDDLTPNTARKVVGAATLIGFSTHNESQLRAAAAEPVIPSPGRIRGRPVISSTRVPCVALSTSSSACSS